MKHKEESVQAAAQFMRDLHSLMESLRARLIEIDPAYKDEANIEDLFTQ